MDVDTAAVTLDTGADEGISDADIDTAINDGWADGEDGILVAESSDEDVPADPAPDAPEDKPQEAADPGADKPAEGEQPETPAEQDGDKPADAEPESNITLNIAGEDRSFAKADAETLISRGLAWESQRRQLDESASMLASEQSKTAAFDTFMSGMAQVLGFGSTAQEFMRAIHQAAAQSFDTANNAQGKALLAQVAQNYERAAQQAQFNAVEAPKMRKQAEMKRFFEARNIPADKVPPEVLNAWASGSGTLDTLYDHHMQAQGAESMRRDNENLKLENESLRTELEKLRKSNDNRAKAAASMATSGLNAGIDEYAAAYDAAM